MKISEIRELTNDELLHKEAALREELFNLKFQFASAHLENVARITQVKRDIAKVLTVVNANKKKVVK